MDAFIGTILPFAGDYAPRDWHICDGTILQVSENQALYSIIGNMYGGTAPTTFALPDLRGRVPVGKGQLPGGSNYVVGAKGGSETVTLTSNNLPPHTHAFNTNANVTIGVPANTDIPTTNTPTASTNLCAPKDGKGNAINIYNTNPATLTMPGQTQSISLSGTTNTTGAGQAFDNHQPYVTINYIICVYGIFPERQ